MIKNIYTIFLALLVALFMGFGLETFYPSPKYPEYPDELNQVSNGPSSYTAAQKAEQSAYDQATRDYDKNSALYNRNVTIIILSMSVLLMALSFIFFRKIVFMNDGLSLGALLILIYGIFRGLIRESADVQFIAVSVCLLVAIVLGYLRFWKFKEEKA